MPHGAGRAQAALCALSLCAVAARASTDACAASSGAGCAELRTSGAQTLHSGSHPAPELADVALLQSLQVKSRSRTSGKRDVRPNLLMIFPDQLRYDWAGFDGPPVDTPTLRKLAAGGTRFTNAYTPSPLCETSRGALASGRDYATSPVPDPTTHYPTGEAASESPTFYQLLKEAGYHTILAGKDHLRGNGGLTTAGATRSEDLGFSDSIGTLDKYINTAYPGPVEDYGDEIAKLNMSDGDGAFKAQKKCYGFLGYGECCDAVPMNHIKKVDMNLMLGGGYNCPRSSPLPDEFFPDNWVEKIAETLLQRSPDGQPWFMQLGLLGPHPPFIITAGMNASVAGKAYPPPVRNFELPEQAKQNMRAGYAALIENIDGQVGKLLDFLSERGELDNTLVAFLSDHGEMLGDFDLVEKSVPWEGSTHVPLIISGPGLKKGATETAPVSTLDLIGTFLDLAGAGKHPGMSAESLLPMLQEGSAAPPSRKHVLSGLRYAKNNYDWHMAVGSHDGELLKLICCPQGCPTSLGNKIMHNGVPALLLQKVVGNATEQEMMSNVIAEFPEVAAGMLDLLPETYRDSCRPLLPK